MKKKIAMIGNAHLDPTWMWTWQEGTAEAKATIRSALDRMKEFDDFIFVCSSASVFEWIEEYDPEMFSEIKERVKEGRFVIVGGWYVQPDCNLPSGEGFARQSLYSQRYFKEKFGVTAKCGYNVDSFGHNISLPQILKESGMDYYIMMRPQKHEKELPFSFFKWRSPDGSEVLTYRIANEYTNRFSSVDELKAKLKQVTDTADNHGEDCGMQFYGVGNHGGGPTIKNIEAIREYRKTCAENDIIMTDPASFLSDYEKTHDNIPVLDDELQHHASGCYSAYSPMKTVIRTGENKLLSAERANLLAGNLLNKEFKTEELKEAWKRINFLHFHDSMGGCCMYGAYPELMPMGWEAVSVGKRIENSAFQSLSWAIGTENAPGMPVIVFNSHPFPCRAEVKVNRAYARLEEYGIRNYAVIDKDGKKIAFQDVHSDTESLTRGSHDTLFTAEIPAYGWNTYYFVENGEKPTFDSTVNAEENVLENEYLKITFDKTTGGISSYYDKTNGKEIFDSSGEALVIDESAHDTWSHGKNVFGNVIGRFANPKFTVTENGPLVSTVKVTTEYENSTLTVYYSLVSGSKELTMRCKLDFREKHRMVKISLPTAFDKEKVSVKYELPFGNIDRPANKEEEAGQKWVSITDGKSALSVQNDCKCSYSADGNILYLTAIRTPIFGDHGGERSDESVYTDQGLSEFTYLISYAENPDYAEISRRAEILGNPPAVIMENRHKGRGLPLSYSGIYVSDPSVIVSAVKRAEDGKGTIVRLYEAAGNAVRVKVDLDFIGASFEAEFSPYKIKTFYIDDVSKTAKEVLITEYDK